MPLPNAARYAKGIAPGGRLGEKPPVKKTPRDLPKPKSGALTLAQIFGAVLPPNERREFNKFLRRLRAERGAK